MDVDVDAAPRDLMQSPKIFPLFEPLSAEPHSG